MRYMNTKNSLCLQLFAKRDIDLHISKVGIGSVLGELDRLVHF